MSNNSQSFLEFGSYRIDPSQRILYSGSQEVPLSPKLFDTLLALVENHGRILEKDELLKRIWPDSFVEEGSLTRYISTLRKTLGENAEDQRFIQTIPKRGYRFAADVRNIPANGAVQVVEEHSRVDCSFDIEVEEEAVPRERLNPGAPASDNSRSGRRQNHFLAWIVSAAVICGLALGLALYLKPKPGPVVRLTMELPPDTELAGLQCPIVALSPDGTRVAFIAAKGGTTRLYVRGLDSMEAKALPGTEGAFCTPFFSPDGQWLGFLADAKLKKVSVSGGAPLVLTALPGGISGASWTADGTIVFGRGGRRGLMKIAATGGTVEPVTTLDTSRGEISHNWPEVIPGTDTVLFQTTIENGQRYSEIVAQDLRTGKRQIVAHGGTYPHYLPTGQVVYMLNGVMIAQPFDVDSLKITGAAFPVEDDIMESGFEAAQFGISRLGSLVYVPGGVAAGDRKLVWVDRSGKEEPIAAPLHAYQWPQLSRDNHRVITGMEDGPFLSGWIYDINRETLTRTGSGFSMNHPIWSPDGSRIAYLSNHDGLGLFWKSADGSDGEERLTANAFPQHPFSWSPDGRYLAFVEYAPSTGADIWMLPMEGERKPRPFFPTPANETTPMISPDGRWLAYASNDSGRYEIYVAPFPVGGQKWQLSNDGGHDPVWARAGNELFYRNDDKILVVSIQTKPVFSPGKPSVLFETKSYEFMVAGVPAGSYDVSSDGQRFLMLRSAVQQPARQINVVVNWFEDLRHLSANR